MLKYCDEADEQSRKEATCRRSATGMSRQDRGGCAAELEEDALSGWNDSDGAEMTSTP